MGNNTFIELCKQQVVDYFNNRADKNELYVDAYKKWQNLCVKL